MRFEKLRFDSTPRYRFFGSSGSRLKQAIVAVCLLLAGGALGTSTVQFFLLNKQTELLHQQIEVAQAVNPSTAKAETKNKTQQNGGLSPAARQSVNGVIQQLNVPWHDIFEQLEKATPPNVALLSVEPDGQRGKIRLQAEATSLDSLLQYASSLEHNGIFGRLLYSKHETNDQDPNRPARLSFELGLSTTSQVAQ